MSVSFDFTMTVLFHNAAFHHTVFVNTVSSSTDIFEDFVVVYL